MELNLSLKDFEKLFPFYISTNKNGLITSFGRSAAKCCPNIKIGIHAKEVFEIKATLIEIKEDDFSLFEGKIVTLKSKTTSLLLNGEVIHLGQNGEYLFAVSPIFHDVQNLINYNLSYADFPTYSPIFDFFILIQAERFARLQQNDAIEALEEQNSFSKLSLEIANFCSRCSEMNEALVFIVLSIHNFIGWDGYYEEVNPEIKVDSKLKIENNTIYLPLSHGKNVKFLLTFTTKEKVMKTERIHLFLGSLRFILESLLERIHQHQVLQQTQAVNLASSKMNTLGEMAAGVAHELNNPLAVIQGLAWMTSSKIEEMTHDKVKDNMEKIIKMTDRSAKIINGLRVFSRDATEDPMEKIELTSVIDETLILCRSKISNRGIQLEIDAKGPYYCTGRSVQISQVLLNLINNAADAIEGSPNPWIKVQIEEIRNFWQISVIDSGLGIPPKILDKMMTPFFTTKPPGKGTGLGLSICSGILKQHGGNFWYDTKSPNTCFKMTIPIYIEGLPT
jgi:signal transduction histidine kinase